MHRFDEQFLLKEANRRMRLNEKCAVTNYALKELKRSQPSARQHLAHALIELAIRLEPSSYPPRAH